MVKLQRAIAEQPPRPSSRRRAAVLTTVPIDIPPYCSVTPLRSTVILL